MSDISDPKAVIAALKAKIAALEAENVALKNKSTGFLGDADFPAEWGDTVPNNAFKNRDDLKKVKLPPRIKKIGRYAFYGCSNLEELVIPPGVEVGHRALEGCWKLPATTELGDADFPPEWGETIPNWAFAGRCDLKKVNLPPRIKKIGEYAFYGCMNLEECVVPRLACPIHHTVFKDCLLDYPTFTGEEPRDWEYGLASLWPEP